MASYACLIDELGLLEGPKTLKKSSLEKLVSGVTPLGLPKIRVLRGFTGLTTFSQTIDMKGVEVRAPR